MTKRYKRLMKKMKSHKKRRVDRAKRDMDAFMKPPMVTIYDRDRKMLKNVFKGVI